MCFLKENLFIENGSGANILIPQAICISMYSFSRSIINNTCKTGNYIEGREINKTVLLRQADRLIALKLFYKFKEESPDTIGRHSG